MTAQSTINSRDSVQFALFLCSSFKPSVKNPTQIPVNKRTRSSSLEGRCEESLCLFICSRKVDKNIPPLRVGHTEDKISLEPQKRSGNDAELGVNIHTVNIPSEHAQLPQ